MKVLMIDNYDSFTYNLVQYLGELEAEVEVVRNDQIGVDQILAENLGEAAADDAADLDVDLAIGKATDLHVAHGHLQLGGDALGQRGLEPSIAELAELSPRAVPPTLRLVSFR